MGPKLMKRFYEVLILLRVLTQVQGAKIKEERFEDQHLDLIEETEMRRKVMYSLCVACDFVKGGDTVTAIATESLPGGPHYWVAANGKIEKIVSFLNEVLGRLEARARSGKREGEICSFEQDLFEHIATFQRERIKSYWKHLERPLKDELERIRMGPYNNMNTRGYASWMQAFQRPLKTTQSHLELSQLAYDIRHSQFLRVGFDPATNLPNSMENRSRTTIRHCIGRLSAPRRAARVLAYAALSHPQFFENFRVESRNSGFGSWRPSKYPDLTLAGIAGRMFPSNSPQLDNFRKALQLLDEKGSIMSRILEYYDSKTWQPRVHAELKLLEALHQRQCAFFNGDKYIACSKPACFCCYHYICSHPGLFARPACHNKVYPNWQPPTLTSEEEDSQSLEQRDIMNKLIQQVRQTIIQKVLNIQSYMKWHPDSSTGITLLTTSEAGFVTGFESRKKSSSSESPYNGDRSNRPDSRPDSSESDHSTDGGVALY